MGGVTRQPGEDVPFRLPPRTRRPQQELADGHYPGADAVIEQAIRRFFEEPRRGADRLEALSSSGNAPEQAALLDPCRRIVETSAKLLQSTRNESKFSGQDEGEVGR